MDPKCTPWPFNLRAVGFLEQQFLLNIIVVRRNGGEDKCLRSVEILPRDKRVLEPLSAIDVLIHVSHFKGQQNDLELVAEMDGILKTMLQLHGELSHSDFLGRGLLRFGKCL
jgi:hypothetical protein